MLSTYNTNYIYAHLGIDLQKDFGLETGKLYVPGGEKIVGESNVLRRGLSDLGVVNFYKTKDWHPHDHMSFFTNNPGTNCFDTISLPDGSKQVMWPPHCVQESDGAELLPGLIVGEHDKVIYKGTKQGVDSYSGFASNDGVSEITELETMLRKDKITHLLIDGLAFEYCVGFTALDAAKRGFNVCVVRSATKGINAADCAAMEERMKAAGIVVVENVADALHWVLMTSGLMDT
jgi:nicotinamidase/pyrazinamidase